MRRREFVSLGCAAVSLAYEPVHLKAQQRELARHVGVIMALTADDPEAHRRMSAFRSRLQQLGWVDGRDIRIDIRWGSSDPDQSRRHAAELAALAPDVILATGSVSLGPLLQVTRAVPVVFVHVPDPVGAGFVESLAQPGGNATGFTQFEYSLSGKWVELLKEIAPGVTRAGVLRDPGFTAAIAQLAAMQGVASSLRLELVPLNVRDPVEIERAVGGFARFPDRGLITTSSPLVAVHRALIIGLAARYKLPAVYFERYLVAAGGLISYGPNFVDQFRRAAGYVDRILKGENPGDLPVQAPAEYELAINLRTANALGLTIPPTLLARADEVIE